MLVSTVKFNFILKSGKEFSAIAHNKPNEDIDKVIETIIQTFKNGNSGYLTVDDCVVRLDDCSVVEWELLELKEVENSATEEPSPD